MTQKLGPVLKPFDIVSAPYASLDGTIKTYPSGKRQRGLFMVLSIERGNVLCAKITSQRKETYLRHSFMLSLADHSFLQTDSFVQLDKLQTFFTWNCSYVGSAEESSRYKIYLILDGFLCSLAEKLRRFCSTQSDGYVSPNVRM